jgi:hypothetical protein
MHSFNKKVGKGSSSQDFKGDFCIILRIDEELANRFGDFFLGKIETIRDNLKASRESLHSPDVLSADVKFEGLQLTHFRTLNCVFRISLSALRRSVFALPNSSEYQSVFGRKMILLD